MNENADAARDEGRRVAPLRRVVRVETLTEWTERAGRVSRDVEVLECGHIRVPAANARFGGTDVGEAKSRRCVECLAPLPRPFTPGAV